jgi:hypothetical protein
VKEYDIYLPTACDDGKPVCQSVMAHVKRSLTDAFGGYTHLTLANEGVWRVGNVTFKDTVTVLRAIDDGSSQFDIHSFKCNLEHLLEQESVLIVVREVRLI